MRKDEKQMINNIQKILVTSIFVAMSMLNVYAQSLPSIDQIGSMSPSQQQALAGQYGVDLSAIGMSPTTTSSGLDLLPSGLDNLGQSDDVTPKVDIQMAKKLLQDQDKREKLKQLERESIPVFERNNKDLRDLKIYGRDFFNEEVSTYAAVDDAPIPNDYIIGVGDNISVLLYGAQNEEIDLIVDRSGYINFPQLGQLSVAGMNLDQINSYIDRRVRNQMLGVDVSISLGKLRSINVFLAGEAKTPGSYSVSALSSVSHILFVAGGISEIGSLRDISVIRSNEVISKFDLYKLLTEGYTQGDIRLQSGDVVFIPPVTKTVLIDGAVKRPGKYELTEEDDLANLIFLAGGLQNRAYLKKALLERFDPKQGSSIVNNINLMDETDLNRILNDGDIIKIARVDNQPANNILVRGAAQRTGQYAHSNGIRFSDIINSIELDLELNADLNKALIIRKRDKNSRDIEVLSLNIFEALDNKKSESDPFLEARDEILIFSLPRINAEFEDEMFLKKEQAIDEKIYTANDEFEKNIGLNSQISQQSMPMSMDMMSNPYFDLMTQQQYEEMYKEKESLIEQKKLTKGDRSELLEPVIKSLYEQASSNQPLKVVSISGAVKVPGEYPLMENSTYFDLIELAGGYTDDALIDIAELRRLRLDENELITTQLIDINLNKNRLNEERLITLSSRDHLRIRRIKDWDIKDKVTLKGEIAYPGEYLISPNEPLSSVISRAGGFTNESFIDAAIFTRESIKEKEREQLNILAETIRRDQASRAMTKESEDFSISSQEIEESISALLSSEIIGRLVVDVPRLLSGDSSADIVLQDGDVIEVPKYTNAVTVVGEIRRAGSFVRQESYSIDDYIELAAGMTSRGNRKEIYIIRANGSVDKLNSEKSRFFSFSDSSDSILAGDTIVVPIKSSYQTPLNTYRTVSQVIFQSIASIAAFSTIFN